MVTGVNGAKSTQQAKAPQSEANSETSIDLKALKTLLALVFTIAATANHNSTMGAASRYASAAGQALILMNAGHGPQNPFIDPNLKNTSNHFAEQLVDNLAQALGAGTKEKAPEPISLNDRHARAKDLRKNANDQEQQIKTEIADVAQDLGLKVKDNSNSAKKAIRKERAKSFEGAVTDLQKIKKEAFAKLQKAQLNGNTQQELQASRDLSVIKIQERIFQSVPIEDRTKKGILEQTQRISESIQDQIEIIEAAKMPAEKKSFFGLLKKTDLRTTESRQRAISGAKETISELVSQAGLTEDKNLTSLITSFTS